jgi:DUF1009 family protein
LHVRGAHEVVPDLLAGSGQLGRCALSEQGRADAELGRAVRLALGPLDAGQAVVAANGKVLAIEGVEGTDAMLRRVAEQARAHGRKTGQGVLVKGPKPGQELRVDMPAIGPRTVEGAVAAGLAGIAVEPEAVLILDREETLRKADAAGCALVGLADRNLPAPGSGEAWPQRGRVYGRRRPGPREAEDAAVGLSAVARLAPFETGAAAVVARSHILAIAGAEHISAMLDRVLGLRQWGDGRKRRRVGVLVLRASCKDNAHSAEQVLGGAAAQGLAGVAVSGDPAALAAYDAAARLADQHGLFLVACETMAVAKQRDWS